MYSVLFYGDSNTWGYDPETSFRFPYNIRWTSVCQRLLGDGYNCIPAGMNGRTTVFDDPIKGARNGLKGLDYELQTHKPIDLFAVMLGTNDLKYADAAGVRDGMERLIENVLSANERFSFSSPVFPARAQAYKPILLVSPIHLRAHVGENDADISESARLSGLYSELAKKHGIHFMDAALYAKASEADGVHLGPDGHEKLGKAMACAVRNILCQ